MSKSQSGLGSIKREWSNASVSAASCSSELIEWEPTPPKKGEPVQGEKVEQSKRIKMLEEIFGSMKAERPTPRTAVPRPLAQSTTTNRTNGKRPSLESAGPAAVPKKKPRQLPPSWRDDALSNSSLSSTNSTSSIKSSSGNGVRNGSANAVDGDPKEHVMSVPSSSASSNSSTSSKVDQVAKLFLSQEQMHILKLVQEGHSLFYTGSAGVSIFGNSWFAIFTMVYRYRKVGASAGNY